MAGRVERAEGSREGKAGDVGARRKEASGASPRHAMVSNAQPRKITVQPEARPNGFAGDGAILGGARALRLVVWTVYCRPLRIQVGAL